jgi:hypothetical protein
MSALGKVFATLFLAPVVIVVAGIGGCEARKAYYDWQVRKLCDRDGGVVVYERMEMSKADYLRFSRDVGSGEKFSPLAVESPVSTETTTTYIRRGSPEVRRDEEVFMRRSDNKILARYVYYARVGGDFPSWAHPSSKGCAPIPGGVSKRVFSIEGDGRQ